MVHRVRAIIIDNNKILAIKRIKKDTVYSVFPGGRVEKYEWLREALMRECREELGVEIKIIRNFVSRRFDRNNIKQLEHFYICEIVSGNLGSGSGPEYDVNSDYEGTHDIEWININCIVGHDLRPKEVVFKLLNYLKNDKELNDQPQ